MKKIFFTLSMFIFVTSAWAQKLTEKDLQGNWKLIKYEVGGISLDIPTGKATMEKTSDPLAAAMGMQMIGEMEGYTESLSMATLEIKGNNFSQLISSHMRNGPFTIIEKDGQQFISATFDNGSSDQIPFSIIDGNLYLLHSTKPKKYIYARIK